MISEVNPTSVIDRIIRRGEVKVSQQGSDLYALQRRKPAVGRYTIKKELVHNGHDCLLVVNPKGEEFLTLKSYYYTGVIAQVTKKFKPPHPKVVRGLCPYRNTGINLLKWWRAIIVDIMKEEEEKGIAPDYNDDIFFFECFYEKFKNSDEYGMTFTHTFGREEGEPIRLRDVVAATRKVSAILRMDVLNRTDWHLKEKMSASSGVIKRYDKAYIYKSYMNLYGISESKYPNTHAANVTLLETFLKSIEGDLLELDLSDSAKARLRYLNEIVKHNKEGDTYE